MISIQNTLYSAILVGSISAQADTEPSQVIENLGSTSRATGLLVGKLVGDTAFDRVWSAATLYNNDDNPSIQLFQLTGRIQLQSIYGNADNDNFNTSDYKEAGNDENVWGNDLEARRTRAGFKSRFYKNWKLDAGFNIDVDGRDGIGGDNTFYKSIQEGGLTYAPSDQLHVSIGKKKVRFSRDQEISSTKIITFERSVASNTLTPGELTGAWAIGKGVGGAWQYEVGIFSNARVSEFAQPTDGGVLAIGKIGYELAEQAGLESCVTTFTYMHNTEPGYRDRKIDPNFTFNASPVFTDSIALSNDLSHGRFGMITEVIYSFGFTGLADQGKIDKGQYVDTSLAQSDLFALTLTPSYFIADRLQAIYRFQLISAADADGIRVPSRYDRLAKGDDENGNTYTAHYAGFNYYINSYKLKLMAGIEYAKMGGGSYDGYTFLSGLRFAF